MTGWYMPWSNYPITAFVMPSRFRATVDPAKCIECGKCKTERCQFNAADFKFYPELGASRGYVNEDKCAGCGNCVETCPVGARGMKAVFGPEYITNIGEEEGVSGTGHVKGAEKVVEMWAELDKDKKLAEEKKSAKK